MITFYPNKIVLVDYPNFNVADTLECGQFFRYHKVSNNVYNVFSLDKFAQVTTTDNVIEIQTEDVEYFYNFFALDVDYSPAICRLQQHSKFIQSAIEYGKGIRLLRQDFVETIFCFIISANNNIKRIQSIIERLCAKYGAKTTNGYAFPTVDALANATENELKQLGAGYRASYIINTAKALQQMDLTTFFNQPTKSARAQLLTLSGVGPKVADCILLFGLNKGDVFPVDTWIKKVYHNYFEMGHADNQIADYLVSLFGEDSGLCQQYLFYFERKYRQIDSNSLQ
ncbi:MAG: 8-oxoguanine DNA glycosylase [Clostridia bacterium]|nr:8-oxoguanine DNA glycosylase [Clostridia bacterium]